MKQNSLRTEPMQERRPGDVTDGSVDYYDFDWGDPVIPEESAVSCGCGRAGAYSCCKTECASPEPAGQDGCIDNLPEQTDDPGYETVTP